MKTRSDIDADILLVEDSPFDAEIILLRLKKAGYSEQTLWVKSGEEALDYLLGIVDSFAKGIVCCILKPLSQESLARAIAELDRLWQTDHKLPV